MSFVWKPASRVELTAGYLLRDARGELVPELRDVKVAYDITFLHVLASTGTTQMVPVHAVRLIELASSASIGWDRPKA